MIDNFQSRTIRLVGPEQLHTALTLISNLPMGAGLELVARKERKVRGLDANARMWAGPLKDIAQQAWVDGRRYTEEVWHEYLKELFLPEDDDPEIELLAKEGYRKWDYRPDGKRVLVGSTTDLLKRGFALYVQQIEAYGATEHGVEFHAYERMAA